MSFFSKISDGYNSFKSKSGVIRFFFNRYAYALYLLLIIVIFFDKNNLFNLLESRATLREQASIERELVYKIDIAKNKIKQLQSNIDTLEMFARENYYFQEKGEDVYLIVRK